MCSFCVLSDSYNARERECEAIRRRIDLIRLMWANIMIDGDWRRTGNDWINNKVKLIRCFWSVSRNIDRLYNMTFFIILQFSLRISFHPTSFRIRTRSPLPFLMAMCVSVHLYMPECSLSFSAGKRIRVRMMCLHPYICFSSFSLFWLIMPWASLEHPWRFSSLYDDAHFILEFVS